MNYQPQSNNYYERLGIDTEVSEIQIKSAFFTAVREYPPEKETELHKLIREAYDVLINTQSRLEYDSRLLHGDVLVALEEELSEAEENEDIDEQVRLLKKLINLSPNVGIYRNKLGLAYLNSEVWDSALTQFRKAIEINPKNPVFHLNAGHALENMENYDEAEKYFLNAYELDPEDYSPPRALASLYYYNYDNAEKAHQILDVAINADGKIDFQDFFCIYDKLQFYTFKGDEKNLKTQLGIIHDIVTNDEEIGFATFMLARIASDLYDHNMFSLAKNFIGEAAKLSPEDEDIRKFKKSISKNAKIVKSLKTIQNSSKVHDFVKHLMTVYIANYYGETSESEYKEQLDQAVDILRNMMDVDPTATRIKESFAYIENNHPLAYNMNNEFFDNIQGLPPASRSQYACPHCREKFNVQKYQYGDYTCPDCSSSVRYDSDGFSRATVAASSGCFIATAVYGDYDHENVLIFRKFRDTALLTNPIGRRLVGAYYALSPKLASYIDKDSHIAIFIRTRIFDKLAILIQQHIPNK